MRWPGGAVNHHFHEQECGAGLGGIRHGYRTHAEDDAYLPLLESFSARGNQRSDFCYQSDELLSTGHVGDADVIRLCWMAA